MKRLCFAVGVFACMLGIAHKTKAQAPAPPQPWQDRIFLGGNLGGIGFSSQGSAIDLSPVIGYRVTEKFSVGAGPIYQYWSNRAAGIRVNNYGGKVFARYSVLDNLFLHTEIELLNWEKITQNSNGEILRNRINGLSTFVGGGYIQPLGGASFLQLTALYNLNQTENSPRPNPLYLSMGFGIGL